MWRSLRTLTVEQSTHPDVRSDLSGARELAALSGPDVLDVTEPVGIARSATRVPFATMLHAE
jgi:hypothetical protein